MQRNNIVSITQDNGAAASEAAVISQSNNAVVDQNMVLLNDCDETGEGGNDATCFT